MKILFLHALADPSRGGGAEVIVWEQLRSLQTAGHDCVLLATSDRAGLHQELRDGVRVWLAGTRNLYWPYDGRTHNPAARALWHTQDSYNPWMQGYLRQVIAAEKPDVISMHNLPGWSAAAWITASRAGIPAVQVLHDSYAICPKATMYTNGGNCARQCAGCRAFRLPHRVLSNRLRAVVGVSRYVLERHLAEGYFAQVPIKQVIHNARDPRALGIDEPVAVEPHGGIRFGYIGRLDPPKGVEPLIDAFRQLPQPDAELWIAGAGKPGYEASLRQRAQGDTRIRFLGRVLPRAFYPQVDVVVVPSLCHDNLPGVVVESFAFGKPVIGARRGGIPELIRDGVNGWILEPAQAGALYETMSHLARNSGVIEHMAQTARQDGMKFMDPRSWNNQYLQVYSAVSADSCSADPQHQQRSSRAGDA
ncbi:glycosyltransferase family 4 protein [Metallibacterium sp.]|uniref:glycosyltransferase family 4 protein n=1 Tax=Metallibacterium sp. TaxID=2940281 RepID=UPI00261FB11B|nr:glycosyltransferase family 4 protein [Metallibacterium sp.]